MLTAWPLQPDAREFGVRNKEAAMKSKANKGKPSRTAKSTSRQKSAPRASKVRDVSDKDLEQMSGGLLSSGGMTHKIV